MPYTLTDNQLDELRALKEYSDTCPFQGAPSINPCPICENDHTNQVKP